MYYYDSGNDHTEAFSEVSKASYAKRVLAGLADAAFIIAFTTLIPFFQSPTGLYQWAMMYEGYFLLLSFLAYRLLAIVYLGRTIGMYFFRIRFLNGEEQALTFKEKLLASLFILFAGTDYYEQNKVE